MDTKNRCSNCSNYLEPDAIKCKKCKTYNENLPRIGENQNRLYIYYAGLSRKIIILTVFQIIAIVVGLILIMLVANKVFPIRVEKEIPLEISERSENTKIDDTCSITIVSTIKLFEYVTTIESSGIGEATHKAEMVETYFLAFTEDGESVIISDTSSAGTKRLKDVTEATVFTAKYVNAPSYLHVGYLTGLSKNHNEAASILNEEISESKDAVELLQRFPNFSVHEAVTTKAVEESGNGLAVIAVAAVLLITGALLWFLSVRAKEDRVILYNHIQRFDKEYDELSKLRSQNDSENENMP